MKKPYILNVRGDIREWDFDIMADPKYVEEWRADGLNIFGPVTNSVPQIIVDMGLMKLWFRLQDMGVIKV